MSEHIVLNPLKAGLIKLKYLQLYPHPWVETRVSLNPQLSQGIL
jgi:hypothetical protein